MAAGVASFLDIVAMQAARERFSHPFFAKSLTQNNKKRFSMAVMWNPRCERRRLAARRWTLLSERTFILKEEKRSRGLEISRRLYRNLLQPLNFQKYVNIFRSFPVAVT